MRFPLPADTFPRVELSDDDTHALKSLAQVVVDAACKQRYDLYEVQKGVVDKRHWKKLKQTDNVSVYKQRSGAFMALSSVVPVSKRASTLPALMTVGTITGELYDVMYGFHNNTLDAMRIKSSYLGDEIVDCALLADLIQPTREDPFRCLQLKWAVKDIRAFARPFMRYRDSVYLEYTGILARPTGERIGFFLRHSVQVAGVRELAEYDIVRGQMSLCSLYRQRDATTVEVFTTSYVDPLGKVNPSYAAKWFATSLVSVSRSIHCAHMKKLTWLLKNSTQEMPERREDKAESCVVCRRVLERSLSVKKSCRLCRRRVCASCRETRRLSFISFKSDRVLQHALTFCRFCIVTAVQTNAMMIATSESVMEGRHLFSDSIVGTEPPTSPIVSDGGLESVTDEFDRWSAFSATSSTSLRGESDNRRALFHGLGMKARAATFAV